MENNDQYFAYMMKIIDTFKMDLYECPYCKRTPPMHDGMVKHKCRVARHEFKLPVKDWNIHALEFMHAMELIRERNHTIIFERDQLRKQVLADAIHSAITGRNVDFEKIDQELARLEHYIPERFRKK